MAIVGSKEASPRQAAIPFVAGVCACAVTGVALSALLRQPRKNAILSALGCGLLTGGGVSLGMNAWERIASSDQTSLDVTPSTHTPSTQSAKESEVKATSYGSMTGEQSHEDPLSSSAATSRDVKSSSGLSEAPSPGSKSRLASAEGSSSDQPLSQLLLSPDPCPEGLEARLAKESLLAPFWEQPAFAQLTRSAVCKEAVQLLKGQCLSDTLAYCSAIFDSPARRAALVALPAVASLLDVGHVKESCGPAVENRVRRTQSAAAKGKGYQLFTPRLLNLIGSEGSGWSNELSQWGPVSKRWHHDPRFIDQLHAWLGEPVVRSPAYSAFPHGAHQLCTAIATELSVIDDGPPSLKTLSFAYRTACESVRDRALFISFLSDMVAGSYFFSARASGKHSLDTQGKLIEIFAPLLEGGELDAFYSQLASKLDVEAYTCKDRFASEELVSHCSDAHRLARILGRSSGSVKRAAYKALRRLDALSGEGEPALVLVRPLDGKRDEDAWILKALDEADESELEASSQSVTRWGLVRLVRENPDRLGLALRCSAATGDAQLIGELAFEPSQVEELPDLLCSLRPSQEEMRLAQCTLAFIKGLQSFLADEQLAACPLPPRLLRGLARALRGSKSEMAIVAGHVSQSVKTWRKREDLKSGAELLDASLTCANTMEEASLTPGIHALCKRMIQVSREQSGSARSPGPRANMATMLIVSMSHCLGQGKHFGREEYLAALEFSPSQVGKERLASSWAKLICQCAFDEPYLAGRLLFATVRKWNPEKGSPAPHFFKKNLAGSISEDRVEEFTCGVLDAYQGTGDTAALQTACKIIGAAGRQAQRPGFQAALKAEIARRRGAHPGNSAKS